MGEMVEGKILLESTYTSGMLLNSIYRLNAGQSFYNAIRTADDVIFVNGDRYAGSAIDFWAEKTGQTQASISYLCSNANCPHGDEPHLLLPDKILILDYDLVGAHIVFNKPTGPIQPGTRFCIIPLCPTCNHYANKAEMFLRHDVLAPILTWTGKQVQ